MSDPYAPPDAHLGDEPAGPEFVGNGQKPFPGFVLVLACGGLGLTISVLWFLAEVFADQALR